MSRRPTRWREEFFARMGRYGISAEQARPILRVAATMQRLAEAQCNGDYPADNGERPTEECAECATYWVPESLSKAGVCPDCRATKRAKLLVPEGWKAVFQGDPRGCILTLVAPDGREIGVP